MPQVDDRVRIVRCDSQREDHPGKEGTIILLENATYPLEEVGTIYHVDCGYFICCAREVEVVENEIEMLKSLADAEEME